MRPSQQVLHCSWHSVCFLVDAVLQMNLFDIPTFVVLKPRQSWIKMLFQIWLKKTQHKFSKIKHRIPLVANHIIRQDLFVSRCGLSYYLSYLNLVYIVIIPPVCLYRPVCGCSLRRWRSAAPVTLSVWIPDLWMKQHWLILNLWTHRLVPSPLLWSCHWPVCRFKKTTVYSQLRINQPFNKSHTSPTRLILKPWRTCARHKKSRSVRSMSLLRVCRNLNSNILYACDLWFSKRKLAEFLILCIEQVN